MPGDLLLGWVLLWGVLPALLAPRLGPWWMCAVALWLDLLLMPLAEPALVLGPRWLLGELLALAVALVPAQLLARWTAEDRRLRARVSILAVLFAALNLWLVPAVIFANKASRSCVPMPSSPLGE